MIHSLAYKHERWRSEKVIFGCLEWVKSSRSVIMLRLVAWFRHSKNMCATVMAQLGCTIVGMSEEIRGSAAQYWLSRLHLTNFDNITTKYMLMEYCKLFHEQRTNLERSVIQQVRRVCYLDKHIWTRCCFWLLMSSKLVCISYDWILQRYPWADELSYECVRKYLSARGTGWIIYLRKQKWYLKEFSRLVTTIREFGVCEAKRSDIGVGRGGL